MIIGNVTIGERSSVWPSVVIRGDVHWIRIGSRTNVQDGSVLHVMKDQFPLALGDDVTVGHGVILHGCMIESRVLIGMGSILLNNVRVGSGSIIAAGTLVPEGTVRCRRTACSWGIRESCAASSRRGIRKASMRTLATLCRVRRRTYRHEPLNPPPGSSQQR